MVVDPYRKEHHETKVRKAVILQLDWELASSPSNQGLGQGNVANRRQANHPSLSLKKPSNLESKTSWLLRVSQTFHRGPLRSNFELEYNLKKKGKPISLEAGWWDNRHAPAFYPPNTSTWSRRCVVQAKAFVGNEPFVVMLGDDLDGYHGRKGCSTYQTTHGWLRTYPRVYYRCYASPSWRSICLWGYCSARRRKRRSLQRWNLHRKTCARGCS